MRSVMFSTRGVSRIVGINFALCASFVIFAWENRKKSLCGAPPRTPPGLAPWTNFSHLQLFLVHTPTGTHFRSATQKVDATVAYASNLRNAVAPREK